MDDPYIQGLVDARKIVIAESGWMPGIIRRIVDAIDRKIVEADNRRIQHSDTQG